MRMLHTARTACLPCRNARQPQARKQLHEGAEVSWRPLGRFDRHHHQVNVPVPPVHCELPALRSIGTCLLPGASHSLLCWSRLVLLHATSSAPQAWVGDWNFHEGTHAVPNHHAAVSVGLYLWLDKLYEVAAT